MESDQGASIRTPGQSTPVTGQSGAPRTSESKFELSLEDRIAEKRPDRQGQDQPPSSSITSVPQDTIASSTDPGQQGAPGPTAPSSNTGAGSSVRARTFPIPNNKQYVTVRAELWPGQITDTTGRTYQPGVNVTANTGVNMPNFMRNLGRLNFVGASPSGNAVSSLPVDPVSGDAVPDAEPAGGVDAVVRVRMSMLKLIQVLFLMLFLMLFLLVVLMLLMLVLVARVRMSMFRLILVRVTATQLELLFLSQKFHWNQLMNLALFPQNKSWKECNTKFHLNLFQK